MQVYRKKKTSPPDVELKHFLIFSKSHSFKRFKTLDIK